VKKTDMERLKAAHLKNQMKQSPIPERFGKGSNALLERRERRKLDQARGLVPFAVKLDAELVKELRALAEERRADVGELVTELLRKGLAG
jgi:Ribbon-helix-helix protein, copG family